MTAYKPGDLARGSVRGVPDVLLMRSDLGWNHPRLAPEGYVWARDHEISDLVPLRAVPADAVVLDLDDIPLGLGPEDALKALRNEGTRTGDWIADQIEAQSAPPRPTEPQGLGAVVEDAEGGRWVRITDEESAGGWIGNWLAVDVEPLTETRHWNDIELPS